MENRQDQLAQIQSEFDDIRAAFDERRLRLWCAAKARAYNRIHGKGGVTLVSEATGISRSRIYAGIAEIERHQQLEKERVRNLGGGRKKND
jgi:hypothetical protein